jgi:hypothetical protein
MPLLLHRVIYLNPNSGLKRPLLCQFGLFLFRRVNIAVIAGNHGPDGTTVVALKVVQNSIYLRLRFGHFTSIS